MAPCTGRGGILLGFRIRSGPIRNGFSRQRGVEHTICGFKRFRSLASGFRLWNVLLTGKVIAQKV